MLLLDRFRPGAEPGDFAPDDDFLDASAWLEEGVPHLRDAHTLLGSATGPGVLAGRIQWAKVLAGYVDKVVYVPGWQTRGAPVMSAQLAAFLWHWTAAKPSLLRPSPSLKICTDGRPAGKGVTAVPGPLVQGLVAFDGVLYVIASGRANHAGMGHQALLERMRKGLPPAGTAAQLGLADTGGSGGALAGFEIEHSGDGSPLTPAQLKTIGQIARAGVANLGFNQAQAIEWDHQAWTRRKIDLDAAKQTAMLAAFKAAA